MARKNRNGRNHFGLTVMAKALMAREAVVGTLELHPPVKAGHTYESFGRYYSKK